MKTTDISNITDEQVTPFLGPASYTEKHKHLFYGRSEEIETLHEKILRTTLTLFYGLSGSGKTSLLNAGVMPKLREHFCLPFRIRLKIPNAETTLINQVKLSINKQIEKYNFKPENLIKDETLWEYFHQEPLWNFITPILIFDQFEEIFSYSAENGRLKAEVSDLFQELTDLIDNTMPLKFKNEISKGVKELNFHFNKPKTKVLFSFREEYLPEIEEWTSKLLSENRSRFRLKRMNGNQAEEVIINSWGPLIQSKETDYLIQYLTDFPINRINESARKEQYEFLEIEPSLLSHVITKLEQKRIDDHSEVISNQLLKGNPKETILRKFYEDGLEKCNRIWRNRLKEFIEDNLITSYAKRNKFLYNNLNPLFIEDIGILLEYRLIRREGDYIELIHDVLTPLVVEDREKRRRDEFLNKEKLKAQETAIKLEEQAKKKALEIKALEQETQIKLREAELNEQKTIALNNEAEIRKERIIAKRKVSIIYTLLVCILISVFSITILLLAYKAQKKAVNESKEEHELLKSSLIKLKEDSISISKRIASLNMNNDTLLSQISSKNEIIIKQNRKIGATTSHSKVLTKRLQDENISKEQKAKEIEKYINFTDDIVNQNNELEVQNYKLHELLRANKQSLNKIKNNINNLQKNDSIRLRIARNVNEVKVKLNDNYNDINFFKEQPEFIPNAILKISNLVNISSSEISKQQLTEIKREVNKIEEDIRRINQ